MAGPRKPRRTATGRRPSPRPRKAAAPDVGASDVRAPRAGFPIVGIGASAGGLEALEELFSAMPVDTGMGFVVVTHQHPGHKSLLTELLGKATKLPVVEASDGLAVQPNRVYVAPPGGYLAILNGVLQRIDKSSTNSPHLPIDYFLRSLAKDQTELAICIVLSGTGTDGTLGLRAIKGESGMAMVQEGRSAKYEGMPASAIATGLADYTVPPAAMPARLVAYSQGSYLASVPAEEAPSTEPLQKIFAMLRSRTGHDFSAYKPSTIRRRIERRMAMHQIEAPAQYARYLQENPHELDTLFRELLISVTSFFRDSDAFDSLAAGALPNLLKSLPDRYTFRIWSAGCATGEEVFSLAILLRECMDAARVSCDVQIFGTDLDHRAIDTARAARYPEGIVADVTRERLDRYFVADDGGFRVCKEIRDMTVFAVQNLVKDPPFTKLDLLSCRNLLIYLNADLQRQLIPMFHYALRPQGILFLGSSETVGGFTDLFDSENKKWKTFRRKDAPPIRLPLAPLMAPLLARIDARVPTHVQQPRETTVAQTVDQLLLARFAPPSVVITERGEVVYIHGRTGAYLEPAAGKPRLNILDMAREGLQLELTAALREVAETKGDVTREGIRVRTNGGFSSVDFTIAAIDEPKAMKGLLLVTFRPHVSVIRDKSGRKAPPGDTRRVERLERELLATKVSLQSSLEDLETSNEELKSTNEELQSTNEEMQSANEELETSREEMQSLNEELTTVNAELLSKLDDLSRANDDMQNLLNSVAVAAIFLDTSLKIVRFTDQARQLIHLIPSDVGRSIEDLTSTLDYEHLVADCREVLRTLVIKQVDVQTDDGQWYLGRILPYRTAENVIGGLVLSFVNISSVKEAETGLRRMAAIVRDSNDAITVQNFAGAITAWNRGAESMYGWTEAEALQLDAYRHVPPERRDEMAAVVRRLERGERLEPFATERLTKDGRVLHVQLTATALIGDRGRPVAVATTERHVTVRGTTGEPDSR